MISGTWRQKGTNLGEAEPSLQTRATPPLSIRALKVQSLQETQDARREPGDNQENHSHGERRPYLASGDEARNKQVQPPNPKQKRTQVTTNRSFIVCCVLRPGRCAQDWVVNIRWKVFRRCSWQANFVYVQQRNRNPAKLRVSRLSLEPSYMHAELTASKSLNRRAWGNLGVLAVLLSPEDEGVSVRFVGD